MIAHRLTTIASADNLLYFKSRSQLVSAEKGSPEYDEIFEKLKCIQYAYGDEDKEKDGEEPEYDEDGNEIIEEEEVDEDEIMENLPTSGPNEGLHSSLLGGKHERGGSIQSADDRDRDEVVFQRLMTGGSKLNPSTEFDLQAQLAGGMNGSGRERLLSDNQPKHPSP